MKRNAWIFITGLAATIASANVPAQAVIFPNGYQQNGLSWNAITSNAITTNALAANVAANGGSSLRELTGVRLEGAELGR